MSDNESKTEDGRNKDDSAFRELDRLERSENIRFKYSALRYVTISVCVFALGSAASLMYAYVNNDRDFEEGAFGSIVNVFTEVFKIIVGMS